jgi:hypothetical protein
MYFTPRNVNILIQWLYKFAGNIPLIQVLNVVLYIFHSLHLSYLLSTYNLVSYLIFFVKQTGNILLTDLFVTLCYVYTDVHNYILPWLNSFNGINHIFYTHYT